jgi:hypothetical protein
VTIAAILVVLCAVNCALAAEPRVALSSGRAVAVWDLFPSAKDAFVKEGPAVEVTSPDGKEKLVFPGGWGAHEDGAYTIFAVTGSRKYPVPLEGYVQPHVIWANDSSGAFVFFSNGGANCCWRTRLISFRGDRVTVTDPAREAAKDFIAYRDKLGIRCEVHHEYPNLYPIGWLDRSHAFIVAETVHHSICDCYGSFRVYEVELPSGRVVKSFAQAASKKMFAGDLPWDLSAAPNDDWDVDPKTCSPRR